MRQPFMGHFFYLISFSVYNRGVGIYWSKVSRNFLIIFYVFTAKRYSLNPSHHNQYHQPYLDRRFNLGSETLQDPIHLSLSLLGSFQCSVNGNDRSSSFRTKKERLILAYLAVEADRPHQREILGEMFWPGKPEGYARMNLRQALSGIRKAIQNGDAKTPFLLITDD
jgi:two-component SAPR family response regulator